MNAIKPIHIQQWQTGRLHAGVKPARRRKAHTLPHSIFEQSVRLQIRYDNPAAHQQGSLPKVTEKGIVTIPEDRVTALLAALDETDRLIVQLLLDETGMRWSELAGLRVSRVDLARQLIRIHETCVEITTAGRQRWNFGSPKDHEVRAIGVSAAAAKALGEHIERDDQNGRHIEHAKVGGRLFYTEAALRRVPGCSGRQPVGKEEVGLNRCLPVPRDHVIRRQSGRTVSTWQCPRQSEDPRKRSEPLLAPGPYAMREQP
jgi:integrase